MQPPAKALNLLFEGLSKGSIFVARKKQERRECATIFSER